MKYLKILGLAALSAMALMSFASTASATTLAIGEVAQDKSIEIKASIKSGTSAVLSDTFGFSANTCTESTVEGSTDSPYTGTSVTGGIDVLTFGKCTNTVTVHNAGTLHVKWTSGTNGTVESSGAKVTVYSSLHGTHITCETGEGVVIGTLTGVKETSEHATMDINAVLNCGSGHLSSARWKGTYTVTSPTGLSVAN